VNFDIIFVSSGSLRPRLNSFDEGVDFGFQNLNRGREWLPLVFYLSHDTTTARRDERINIGPTLSDNSITVIRGYSVPIVNMSTHRAELKLCGSEMIQNNASLSFRWLQTVYTQSSDSSDTVYLDNVTISINFPEGYNMTLLEDDFKNEMMIK
jgi:hypothetical protein